MDCEGAKIKINSHSAHTAELTLDLVNFGEPLKVYELGSDTICLEL